MSQKFRQRKSAKAKSENPQRKMGGGRCGPPVEDEEESEYDPPHHGPIKDRSCTDVLCLLLLIAFAAVWGVISVYAFANGNPVQLIYPSNSRGQIY